MSHTYALAVTTRQADAYIEQGIDFFGGFAVEASAIEEIVDISAFISLFNLDLPGSPFAPDRPVDILEVPSNSFMRVRHAVSPLDKRAVFGGIVEFPPYDGSGTVRAGEVETDLLWIEPTRLSTGTRLLRYYPGQREPQVRGIYHGVTWGWEDCTTDKFRPFTPSHLVGPAISRVWGETPVDIETDADMKPVAVQMACPQPPEEESGFEQVESGLFAKRIAYHDDLHLHEPHLIGKVNSIPVRVIRTMRNEDGNILAFCIALILDMPLVFSCGFERWSQAIASITVPIEEVENLHMQVAEVDDFDSEKMPVVTLLPSESDDMERMLGQAFLLLSALIPEGWAKASVLVQIVGESVGAGGVVFMPENTQGDGDARDGDGLAIEHVPSAFNSYAVWLKEENADSEAGAPLSVRFDFEAESRNVNIELNYMNALDTAEDVPLEQWARELERFPRSDEKTPEWLRQKVEKFFAERKEEEKAAQAERPVHEYEDYGRRELPSTATLRDRSAEAARELLGDR